MDVLTLLKEQVKGKELKIIYPEGTDSRVLGAACRHQKDGFIHPIVIGNPEEIQAVAEENGYELNGLEIIDPTTFDKMEELVQAFVERRKGKATEEKARELLKDANYFATMLVYLDKADGMVSGAVGTTGDTIRPGLQIIKTKPGTKLVSGAMLLLGPKGERILYADTAVTIQPTPEQMAEIAKVAADTAQKFGIDPKVAFLSFSTKGSASSPEQEKVAEAARLAKEMYPEMISDGEMQFDAAIDPTVGARKAPGSPVAGHANVFVFPDIQAGNIAYKITERLGGYQAIGPILQGLAKPVNDLSRGCNEDDAYMLALITAATAATDN